MVVVMVVVGNRPMGIDASENLFLCLLIQLNGKPTTYAYLLLAHLTCPKIVEYLR